MKGNMIRAQKELDSINTDRYTKELTIKSIELMKNKCEKFYHNLENFYKDIGTSNDSKITYNP